MGVGGVITAGVRMVRRDLEGQEEGRNPPAPLRPARLLSPASWGQIQECQQVDQPSSCVCLFCPSLTFSAVRPVASLCTSLEVSVFEVPVLKREALLLPLAPFLIVEVNVCSLKQAKKTLEVWRQCGRQSTHDYAFAETSRSLKFLNSQMWFSPAQTHQWWSWVLRASETTSCTWCGTSTTASSGLWLPDTGP